MAVPRGRTCFYDEGTRVWRGAGRPPLFNVHQSLGQLVLAVLRRTPSHVTQISADTGVTVTCDELWLRTVRVAQHLTRLGYRDGDMATIAVRNGEHTAPVLFACFTLGIVVNTLDPSFVRSDFAHMLALTRPVLVFCDRESLPEMDAALATVALRPRLFVLGDPVTGDDSVAQLLEPTGTERSYTAPDLDDPEHRLAIIICSSGTTGPSKGVRYSHGFCIANLPLIIEIDCTDRVLAFSSLYWLSGLAMLLIGTLSAATRIITRAAFDPATALAILARHRATAVFFPPAQLTGLLADPALAGTDTASVRQVLCGGAAVSAALYRAVSDWLPAATILVGYGMSETCICTLSRDLYRPGSAGSPQPGAELRIVADDGTAQPPDVPGEVHIRSRYHFDGYHGDPAATAATIDQDGWVRSGDIGRFDEDGLLYIVDRKKDILKHNGYQVSPSALEATLKAALSGIAECCVVGVETPGNELPAAIVVPRVGHEPETVAGDIRRYVEQHLAPYQQLRGGVLLVDTLPMTPSGKVIRRECRMMAERRYRERSGAP